MPELAAPPRARPAGGMGHYLRDLVYGAVDGVVTTLAVVSGATGANLSPRIALILGLANLAADGLSMGVSNYLALKSELEQTGEPLAREKPWRHGLATSAAFAVVGSVPLLAFAFPPLERLSLFQLALGLSVLALGAAGVIRARFVDKPAWRSALEMVVTGAVASGAAYAIGGLAERLTR